MSLAGRFHDGDESVVAEVLRELGPRITCRLGRRYRRLLAADRVEQVLLDALAQAWEQRAQFDATKGSLGAWLSTIADHCAVNFIRSATGQSLGMELMMGPDRLRLLSAPPTVGPLQADDERPEDFHRNELRDSVREAVDSLPAGQRYVLLADANSSIAIPCAQLAVELGVSVSTVRQYRRRGLKRLKAELLRRGVEALLDRRPRNGAQNSREPGAGSREPGAGSREPGAGSREPGAGSQNCKSKMSMRERLHACNYAHGKNLCLPCILGVTPRRKYY
jgi:RNA polymerase sigma factor (sigma-70 family)